MLPRSVWTTPAGAQLDAGAGRQPWAGRPATPIAWTVRGSGSEGEGGRGGGGEWPMALSFTTQMDLASLLEQDRLLGAVHLPGVAFWWSWGRRGRHGSAECRRFSQ